MRRIIYDKLVQWKQERNGTTALLIEGARRIGKSYTAEEFARNEYESYIQIDFSKDTIESSHGLAISRVNFLIALYDSFALKF